MANIALITNNILSDSGTALTSVLTGSGTTNYLSKFTGSTALGNSIIYDNGTAVGIGTTSPSYLLDINGTTRSTTFLSTDATSSTGLYITAATTSGAGAILRLTKNASDKQVYQTFESDTLYLGVAANQTTVADIGTKSGVNLAFNTAYSERMRIASSGNVLIGTTTDNGAKLQVSGNATITGNAAITGITSTGNKRLSLGILDINSGGTPTQIRINTTIPFASASADFTVNIKGFRYGSAQMVSLSIGWHYYLSSFYNRNAISSGSWTPTITLACDASGYVVIHLSNPDYWPKLYVESVYSSAYMDSYSSGWTWTDADLSNCTSLATVTCKPLATDITGNSGSTSAVSGTTNYISKFTSSTAIGNSSIYDNGTNIGIGTTSPQKVLDVVSGLNDFVTLGANGLSVGQWAGIHFGYRENNTNYRKSAIVFERTDNAGGGGNAAGKIYILNGPGTGAGSATLADAKLTIDEYGKVGIGTTSPSQKLTVGDGTGTGNQYIRVYSSSSDIYIGQSGSGLFGLSANAAANIAQDNSSYPLAIGTTFSQPLIFGTINVERMRIASSGNVLIGTTTDNGYKLDVNGIQRVQYGSVERGAVFTHSNGTTAEIVIGNGSAAGVGVVEIHRNGTSAISMRSTAILFNISRLVTPSTFFINGPYGGSNIGTSVRLASNTVDQGVYTATSGTQSTVVIGNSGNEIWQPSSGNATYNLFSILPSINTSGTYAGIVRGFYYSPTLTSVTGVTHRAIETVSGDVILGSSSGNVGVGTTTLGTATRLTLGGSQTASSAIARGGLVNTTLVAAANSDVLVGLDITPTFTNGAFTGLTNLALRVNGYTRLIGSDAAGGRMIDVKNSSNTDCFYVRGYGDAYIWQTLYLGTLNGSSYISSGGLSIYSGSPTGNAFIRFIHNNGTNALRVLSNSNIELNPSAGNVLVGTTTDAGYKLDVNGTGRFSSSVTALSITGINSVNTSGGMTIANDLTWTNNIGYGLKGQDGTRFLAYTTSGTQLDTSSIITFLASGSEKMRITSSGNVGIGTTNPLAKLTVLSSGFNVSTFDSTYGQMAISFANNGSVFSQIGSGNSVTPTAAYDDLGFGTAGLNKNIVFATGSSFTERMRITSGGDVGIGTASPAYKLDVNGTSRFADNIALTGSNRYITSGASNQSIVIAGGSSATNGAYFHLTGNTFGSGSPGAGSAEFVIRTNSDSKFAMFGYNGSTWSRYMTLFGPTGNLNIGYGTSDLGYKFSVQGDAYITGTVIGSTALSTNNYVYANTNESGGGVFVYADITSGPDNLYSGGQIAANIYTSSYTNPITVNTSTTVAIMHWYPSTSNGVFIDYVLNIGGTGGAMRSGTFTVVNDNAGIVNYTEVSTPDINSSTAAVVIEAVNNSGTMEVQVTNTSGQPAYINIITRYIPPII